jgi:creatinine amidohydrolase/Fe(II)-dependent formamide hydrolase-like protein
VSFVDMMSLTWPEAEALSTRRVLGLIPLGAVEQHGPHLPVATDSLIAEHLARRIAESLDESVVVAPVLRGGISTYHLHFPGTVDLPASVVKGVVSAYIASMAQMGIQDIALFSSHGGNFEVIGEIAAESSRDAALNVVAYDDLPRYLGIMFSGARRAGLEPGETDTHAGAVETSQALFAFPNLVRDYRSVAGYTAAEAGWGKKLMEDGVHTLSETGVFGHPPAATVEAGAAIFDALCEELASWMTKAFDLTEGRSGRTQEGGGS